MYLLIWYRLEKVARNDANDEIVHFVVWLNLNHVKGLSNLHA